MTNAIASLARNGLIASLGEVMQLAYVPKDFDAALKFWIETMGAGPFYSLEHVRVDHLKYRGLPSDVDFSMMLGNWGEMQIELIRQHNDAPSIYTEWLAGGHEGLQHVCILVDDMAHARAVVAKSGGTVVQEGKPRGGEADVIYVDTHGGPGTMVEILQPTAGMRAFFASIRDAHRGWDGSNPIRQPGR